MPICPVCQSPDVTEVFPPQISSGKEISFSYTFSPAHNKTFGIFGCKACSHQFCYPVSSDIGMNYKDVVDDEYIKHEMPRRLTARKLLQTLAAYKSSGKLVDVGCATGDFLVEAKGRGFDVEGIEPCAWSGNIARGRGLVVHPQLLQEFAAGHHERYDVATLWGVIEHFADPAAEVQRIASILKPGGLLALWTGDVESITSRALGRRWWYWQGQHIQYFTHRSLVRLLSTAGFGVVASKTYPFAASHETISNSLKRYRYQPLWSALLKPVVAVRPILYLYLPGEMLVIAEKRTSASS